MDVIPESTHKALAPPHSRGTSGSEACSVSRHSAIVVIDDDEHWVEAVQSLLSEEGFEVQVALDGSSGLDLLDRCSPLLVLLDVNLPDLNGIEILRDLRSRAVRAPIIMISGEDQARIVGEAFAGGATTFLRKPVSKALLMKAVHRYTAHR